MHKALPAALAVSLALGGCAGPAPSAHDPHDGVAVPRLAPSLSASQVPGLAIDRWWMLFDDPALDQLVTQALQHNHHLAAAAARVREARAQLNEARSAQQPSAQVLNHSRRARQSGDGVLPPGTALTGSSHQAQLVTQYELDLWGRLAAGSDAARQRLLAQEWARATLQWSLTAQLAEAHFGLRAVWRQIEISEAVRSSRQRTLSLRRQEHAAGSASEFDLRRAEAELAGTEATLAGLQRQRVALESALTLLSGRPVAELTAPPGTALDTARPFSARLPQGDAANLLLQRPDLRQAEARLAAARADIRAARAAALPSVRLTGMVGSDVRALSDLFSGAGFVWSVAAGVTQSLFDGGQAKARIRQADARADAAQADYRQAVLAAVVELREAYAALDISLLAQRAEHERVIALDRARRLAQLGFDNGAIGQLDLLDAERNAYQAQLNEVTATRDRLISQVAAFKALGGGHAGADPQGRSGGHAGAEPPVRSSTPFTRSPS